jgi:hypothetical protein
MTTTHNNNSIIITTWDSTSCLIPLPQKQKEKEKKRKKKDICKESALHPLRIFLLPMKRASKSRNKRVESKREAERERVCVCA